MSTYFPSGKGLEDLRKWFVLDADGATVGRLAAQVANILMGKNKPTYTPFLDTGDHGEERRIEAGRQARRIVSTTHCAPATTPGTRLPYPPYL